MNDNPSDTTTTPADEMLAAARKLREGRLFLGADIQSHDRDYLSWLGSLVANVDPLADLLEFMAGASEYNVERGRANTIQDDYVLAVARAINGTAK